VFRCVVKALEIVEAPSMSARETIAVRRVLTPKVQILIRIA
jgi:hypothetical protein